MKPKKLNCAVIGVGKMGINHVRVYAKTPDIDFTSVAELSDTLGQAVAKEFNVKLYKNYEDLLDTEKPDLVSICVPTSFHYVVAKTCIEKGVNILLEKPICTEVGEAEELLTIAKKNKVKMLVGHIERHNPAVKKVKEMIDQGKLGQITSIIARRVGGFPYQIRDANIMADLAIHDIDIINYLLDDLPKEVYVNRQRIHIEKREDSVEYFLKYKHASGYVQTNWITPVKIRKLNITGSEGYIEMDYITQKIEFYKSNFDKFKEDYKGFSDYVLRFSESDIIDVPVEKKEPLTEEIHYFINCVRNDISIDSEFAKVALEIALT